MIIMSISCFLQHIYNTELAGKPDAVRAKITFQVARRSMEYSRRKAVPANPATIEDLIANFESNSYPQMYQDMYLTTVHADFRQRRRGSTRGERETRRRYAIILVNRKVLDRAFASCTFFAMDGTFKTTPQVSASFRDRAAQMLCITADYSGKPVVLYVVLMQTRKIPLYREVFKAIHRLEPRFNPGQMMADFERAMRNSYMETFPDTRLLGCR